MCSPMPAPISPRSSRRCRAIPAATGNIRASSRCRTRTSRSSMAHGYYRVSGKPAVVMVHVTVGTANAICALMNAARDNARSFSAPAARRSPRPGTRPRATARSIGARKCSTRAASPANSSNGITSCAPASPSNSVVDRALDIAMSEPRGPVYLTLPREVLADPAVAPRRDGVRPLGASAPVPEPGGDRAGGRDARRGRISAAPHLVGRAHAGSHGGTRRARRRIRVAGGAVGGPRHQPADRSPDVPRLRSRRRYSARPTWSRCSTARCRGFRGCIRCAPAPR